MRKLVEEYQSGEALPVQEANTANKTVFHTTADAFSLYQHKTISLKEFYTSQQFDLGTILELAAQIVSLLGDIHDSGRFLRFFSPENIYVDPVAGSVSLQNRKGDATFSPSEQHPFDKDILPYLSPESTGRIKGQVDYRTDLYSVGVILYEMIAHRTPFPVGKPLEMIHAHIARIPEPPESRHLTLPKTVSDIVIRLLAKNPDERYQSSYGLLKDLNECQNRLTATGKIDPFELGMHDMVMMFRRPSFPVGRSREVSTLTAAFERSANGNRELVMIAGEPGSGKTALSETLREKVEEMGGIFIYGENEPSVRNTPYFSIIKAFKQIVMRLLSSSEYRINIWREKLSIALAANGAVITEVLPEIELIIGPQPRLPDVGPEETKNRFKGVFRNFVSVFATEKHPLVIFLDDLQWADSGSFDLIYNLITDKQIRHLLIVGTYRNADIHQNHPLNRTLQKISQVSEGVASIFLNRLSTEQVYEILKVFYKIRGDNTLKLAELIQNKTQGNPFFINQFIKSLYEKKLFKNDLDKGWYWDFDSIQKMQVTENVIDLLKERINQLSRSVVDILTTCSCIGSSFEIEFVATVTGIPVEKVETELASAAHEGILNFDYSEKCYRFEHERIREIVYALIPLKKRERIHYRIGHIIRFLYAENKSPDYIYPVVHHLRAGKNLLITSEELQVLIEFTVMAGEQARQANAYQVAAGFYEDALALLPENGWTGFYDITYRCFSGLAISQYLSLNFERAEEIFNIAITNIKNRMDKAYLYNIKAIMVANQGHHKDAVELCFKGLKLFGFDIPYHAGSFNLVKEIIKTKVLIGFKNSEDLLNLPELKGRKSSLITDLAMTLLESSFFLDPKLQALVTLVMVQFFIRNGINDKSAFFFMTYAYFLLAGLKETERSAGFGEMAMEMNRKYENAHIKAKIGMIHAITISIRKDHMGQAVRELEKNFDMALENGDFRYGMYTEQCILFTMISKGEPLAEIEAVYDKNYDFLVKTRDSGAVSYNDSVRQTIKCLRGETRSPMHLDDPDFSEKKHIKKMKGDNIPIILQRHYLLRLMVFYVMGYYEEAYAAACRCRDYRASSVGLITEDDRRYYTALSLLAIYRSKTQKVFYRKRELKKHIKQLLKCAETSPVNFKHKYLLLKAELAFTTGSLQKDDNGKFQSPETLYGRAIQSASENGFLLDSAIACERAAEFYQQNGICHISTYYFKKAADHFNKWGAPIKIRQLTQRNPELLNDQYLSKAADTGVIHDKTLDYKSMVNSLQMISTEIVLERLLEKLMKVIAENAGAERAVFISLQEEQDFLEAELNLTGFDKLNSPKLVVKHTLADENINLLQPVINLVRRTGEYIVIDNAQAQGDFVHHSYVKEKRIKSVLCLPVKRQSEIIALLYLENNVSPGVFTLNRIEVLQLLASQAAISFENARLYDSVSRKEIHLRTLSDKLRSLASELVQTEDRERRKIAVELHDHLGHALANIRISLGMLLKSEKTPENFEVLERIRGLVDQSITDVQSLTFELSPPVLYDLGLEGAIDWLAFNTAKQHGLTINYNENGEKIKMSESVRAILFRSVRELMFNIVKHAKASSVTITSKSRGAFIYIEIQDDGIGFSTEDISDTMKTGGGFGLFSIQERLAGYGGQLVIETEPGKGTRILIISPLKDK